MSLTRQEKVKLVEFRSRMFLALQNALKNPTSFDSILPALWSFQSVNVEWMIILSPYMHKAGEAINLDGGFNLFNLITGAVEAKKFIGIQKEMSAIIFDENTRDAFKTMFEGSPVTSLSSPVGYNTNLNTGGKHSKTVNGQFFAGQVTTTQKITYSITFSDQTKLEWQPSDDSASLNNIRKQFDAKIQELKPAKQARLA